MIEIKTLFILGAGASYPYGYPLGKQLVLDIINDMEDEIFFPTNELVSEQSGVRWTNNASRNNGVLYNLNLDSLTTLSKKIKDNPNGDFLPPNRYSSPESDEYTFLGTPVIKIRISLIDKFNALRKALKIFDPISIDAFLRDNPSHKIAGKMMIVYSLLKRENPDKFMMSGGSEADNWYASFLNDLISDCADDREKLLLNDVSILTFNYDVSLDYYLSNRFSQIEGFQEVVDSRDANKKIYEKFLANNLKIEHVYGQIRDGIVNNYGEYFDKNLSENNAKNINLNLNRFIYSFDSYAAIHTMYDDRNNKEKNESINKFKTKIMEAKEIIFIGFGFDRDNLNQIGFPNSKNAMRKMMKDKTIRYLNYGGCMTSLDQQFDELKKNGSKNIEIIRSIATSITSAYMNDF